MAWIANRHLLCALLVSLGQSIVVWEWYFPSAKRKITAQIAALLPLIFIGPMVLIFQHYAGTGSAARASNQRDNPTLIPPGTEDPAGVGSGGDYQGVILWPEAEKQTVLVPPIPAIKSNDIRSSSEPLSIPFYGVYWLYRAPYRQPPRNSLNTRGSPDKVSFRSADGFPMIMEAHQNFGKHLNTNCCRAIQLSVMNEDPMGKSVLLELILVDSATKQRESLGRTAFSFNSTGEPEAGLLTFSLPAHPELRAFDEVEIRYHLPIPRRTHSARLAIKRFILVPRGL